MSLNTNSKAIKLLEKYWYYINYRNLSLNSNAIELLEKNQNEIHWYNLSSNPSIFELDYKSMINNNKKIEEELLIKVMEPSRIFKNGGISYLNELFGN